MTWTTYSCRGCGTAVRAWYKNTYIFCNEECRIQSIERRAEARKKKRVEEAAKRREAIKRRFLPA